MENKDVKDIAEFIICYSKVKGSNISPLKLQKLLYYTQAWNLVYFNDPLFDEEPQAWVNGPVYPTIYNEYKTFFRGEEITFYNDDPNKKLEEIRRKIKLSSDKEELLNEILTKYSTISTEKLVYLTHVEEPWLNARKGSQPFDASNKIIDRQTIKDFYSKRIKND